MAEESPLHPVGELLAALRAQKIRFIIAGLTSAVLQGAPMATIDTDVWVDLPVRAYVRILALCQRLGAQILTGTVVGLRNDARVDFLYRVTGLKSFSSEWKQAVTLEFAGERVKVLRIESLIRRKEAVGRPKDIAQLPVLRDYLASLRISESGKCGKPRRTRG